jgi:hypothetical protein
LTYIFDAKLKEVIEASPTDFVEVEAAIRAVTDPE